DSACFDGALFEGDVDFSLIKVGLNFSIIPVIKNSLEIKTILKGNVKFGGAKIGGQFQANGAYFGDSIKIINFNGIQVEESAFFVNAVFRGQVNFVAANIMGLLDVSGAQFLNETPAAFEGIKVGSSAIFRDTIFLGNILLNHSTFTDLYIEGNYLCSLISLLHMDSTIVQRELRIANTKVNTFYANHLQVMGPARLINIFITDLADFQNASYQSLDLSNVTWPRSRNNVLLEGLTYETISAEGNPNDCDGLLNWLKSCRFSRQPYTQLESYFLKWGHKESADKVFIRMRQKEVALLSWWKKWPTKILWGGLTGYGRKPYLSIPWIVLIVALGALAFPLTFDGKTLESHLWLTQMAKSYSSTMKIILSLDRFLPGVDLGVAKYWAPPVNFCFLAWIYWYIQKLLGWVLVPIALAAIYTRIK
ncbi:MAG: hypothetical protein Q7O12_12425, partial [Deltaproteobacteria bacterium]|nr:hypothetical protein [Deltaproteobacteria bacterium]